MLTLTEHRTAMLTILADNPSRWWTVREVFNELPSDVENYATPSHFMLICHRDYKIMDVDDSGPSKTYRLNRAGLKLYRDIVLSGQPLPQPPTPGIQRRPRSRRAEAQIPWILAMRRNDVSYHEIHLATGLSICTVREILQDIEQATGERLTNTDYAPAASSG